MADELAVTVATVLATKGAQAAVEGAKTAVGALVRLVRDRLTGRPGGAGILDAAIDEPDDPRRRAALADALGAAMAGDPDFAARLLDRWRDARMELTADHGGVINQISGTADKVVQARTIHGNITF